jgi:hypothetical protein
LDAVDSGPVPTEFVALTSKVYDVPGVRPVMSPVVVTGALLTTTGVCAVDPIKGVTV